VGLQPRLHVGFGPVEVSRGAGRRSSLRTGHLPAVRGAGALAGDQAEGLNVDVVLCAALTICVLMYVEWLSDGRGRWFR